MNEKIFQTDIHDFDYKVKDRNENIGIASKSGKFHNAIKYTY